MGRVQRTRASQPEKASVVGMTLEKARVLSKSMGLSLLSHSPVPSTLPRPDAAACVQAARFDHKIVVIPQLIRPTIICFSQVFYSCAAIKTSQTQSWILQRQQYKSLFLQRKYGIWFKDSVTRMC